MENSCPATFWRFAVPVMAGNVMGAIIGFTTKAALPETMHPATRDTIGVFVGGAASWLVSGLVWVAIHPKPTQQRLAGCR